MDARPRSSSDRGGGGGRGACALADLQANGLPSRLALRDLHLTSQGAPVLSRSRPVLQVRRKRSASSIPACPRPTPPPTSSSWTGGPPRAQRVDLTKVDAPSPRAACVSNETATTRRGAPRPDPWLWDFVVSGEAWPRADDPTAGPFDLPSSTSIPRPRLPVRCRSARCRPVPSHRRGDQRGERGLRHLRRPAGSQPLREHPGCRPAPHRQHAALSYATDSDAGASSTWDTSTSTPRVSAWLRSRPFAWVRRAPARATTRRPVPHRDPPGLPPRGRVVARLKVSEGCGRPWSKRSGPPRPGREERRGEGVRAARRRRRPHRREPLCCDRGRRLRSP